LALIFVAVKAATDAFSVSNEEMAERSAAASERLSEAA
jgi:hypothetical protein